MSNTTPPKTIHKVIRASNLKLVIRTCQSFVDLTRSSSNTFLCNLNAYSDHNTDPDSSGATTNYLRTLFATSLWNIFELSGSYGHPQYCLTKPSTVQGRARGYGTKLSMETQVSSSILYCRSCVLNPVRFGMETTDINHHGLLSRTKKFQLQFGSRALIEVG
jgi:hypothetical protein